MTTLGDLGSAPTWVVVERGRIVEIGRGAAPRGAIVAPPESVLAPAFVDLQVNGIGPVDLAVADAAGWLEVGSRLERAGVGAWCPTLVTAPPETYAPFLERVLDARRAAAAAQMPAVLGAHLEGPFLGAAPGVHDPGLIRAANVKWILDLLDRFPGSVTLVTIAPEADPDGACTRALHTRGVTVSLGHSRASANESRVLVDAGASAVTHIFNAMDPLHHREPGLVGVALADPRVTPMVIADGVHVDLDVVGIVLAAREHTIIVSDSVAVTPPLIARDGAAFAPTGTLAGATTLLDGALKNLRRAGHSLSRTLACVTTAPAALIGTTEHGALKVGAQANIVALDAQTATLTARWRSGRPPAPR